MTARRTLVARPPDPVLFEPFGAFVTPPSNAGHRAPFDAWLEPVPGLSPSYHLNRVAGSRLPVTVQRVERHPHAAQLFLPIRVERYLVTVMPSKDGDTPDPEGARSFVVPGTMGVAYRQGTWHAGITALGGDASFAVMMWRGAHDDDVFASIPALEVVEASGAEEASGATHG